MKNQQRFILEEEVSVSLKKLAAILSTLCQFLKQYDETVKFPALYPLPKPKQEIGFTLFTDELFAHYFQDIKEHCNRQICLSFRFERNKECCFSVVLSVKDLDENITISSLEIPLAAWSLLLSQRQEFLDNHLPRVPITPNQQGTFEMREEVLSSVGAQDTDTSGHELSDLEDIEFSWEDPAVDVDSVYRPGIDE